MSLPAAYTVGQPTVAARRLHLNEFRHTHSEKVRNVLANTRLSERLAVEYQTGPSEILAGELAAYVGVPEVLVTSGSDDALRAIVDVAPFKGITTVVMPVPSYVHFEHYVQMNRALRLVQYPIGLGMTREDHVDALGYHSDLMAAGALVYLCSPNNPTGDMWSAEDVGRLAREFPKSLFLIDEAYIEFAWAPLAAASTFRRLLNHHSAVGVTRECRNVAVTRTMSKAFGLAGLRVGYVVACPELLKEISVGVNPKAFNAVAGPVATAALDSLDWYYEAVGHVRVAQDTVVGQLRREGWDVYPTPANFYLVYVGDTRAATEVLAAAGVVVRDRTELPGLAGFVRVTVGTADDNAAVVRGFRRMVSPGRAFQVWYTPKSFVARVKSLMRQAIAALEAVGLPFWAQSGTMLGIRRHGGMIPSDDDGDLAYARYRDGTDPVADFVGAFSSRGLTLQRNRTDAYWQIGTNPPKTKISEVHIDLFSYTWRGEWYILDDPRYAEEDPTSDWAECNTKYTEDELFPLVPGKFYDMTIMMPAQTDKVLRRSLGDDCMRVMRMRTQQGVLAVPLTDYSPA